MLVIVAKIRMKSEFREPFLESMLDDARGSMGNERGCMHFSVVQDVVDPDTITLFEVYTDEEAFEEHKKMPHFVKWQETVKDWFAAPTEVTKSTNLFPPNDYWKK